MNVAHLGSDGNLHRGQMIKLAVYLVLTLTTETWR